MAAKPLQLISGIPTEVEAVISSAGAGDSGKLPALDAAGKLDASMIPGTSGRSMTASETLAAGDLINVWDDAGTPKIRKADASDAGKRAHGFSPGAITSGNSGAVTLREGEIAGLTGLVGGTQYYLSAATPGGLVTTAPAGSGNIVQRVGVALSATELSMVAGEIVVRA